MASAFKALFARRRGKLEYLLVAEVRILGNAPILLLRAGPGDLVAKEGQALATVVAHGDAARRHEDQHGVQVQVRQRAAELLQRVAGQVRRHLAHNAKENPRDHQAGHHEAPGLVQAHISA
eukprot:scaffold449_cov241-Pinguiococcus_pyrenoidosus.AAC.25